MKKLYPTIFALTLGFSFAFAQGPTFELAQASSSNVAIANNHVFDEVTSASLTTASNFILKNITATTQTYTIFKNDLALHSVSGSDNAEASFCTGSTCYPPNVNSANAVIAGNSNLALIADLLEASAVGQSTVSYDINNGLEQLSIVIRYNYALSVVSNAFLTAKVSNVYPNPSNDKAFIDVIADRGLEATSLNVYNSIGALVSTKDVSVQKGTNTFTIETSNLTSGIYFVNISNGGSIITKKFLVNK
jgi:hypothetical protein